MIHHPTPELSEAQRNALEQQHRDRGLDPVGCSSITDDRGVRTVWWSCDLTAFDPQEAMNLRARLAQASFYSDVSDVRIAHGFRSDQHPGGTVATDALLNQISQVQKVVRQ